VSVDDRFVVSVVLGRWQANCYVLADPARGTAVVVDPGEGGGPVVTRILERFDLRAEAILLTHGHLDHVWSTPQLARGLDVPVLLHDEDRWLFDDPGAAFGVSTDLLAAEFGLEWDPPIAWLEPLVDGQRLTFAGTRMDVRHSPGHTPGHVTFLAHDLGGVDFALSLDESDLAAGAVPASRDGTVDDAVLFSGDLVFAGSIGRTDFPRGDTVRMQQSLVETVLDLEDDTLVLSGHGPWTTVGRERVSNPFLRELVARAAE